MELFLLPLLLLGVLLTTLDGGSGDDTSDNENDTLDGSQDDRVAGGNGDDQLSLHDKAVGFGGTGQDTLTATDTSLGYGLAGKDRLTAIDNATIKGGAGDDWLSASGEAKALGGAGDDEIAVFGDAFGNGGAGDDTLTASDDAMIRGGDGDDMLIYQDGGSILSPEEGADTYVLSHSKTGGDELGFGYQGWDASDRFAIHLGTNDLSNFTFSVTPGSEDGASGPKGDITEISVTERLADGTTVSSSLWLRGVYGFNLRDIVLYGEEIGDVVDWKEYFGENDLIKADGSETVHGGVGNDHIDLEDSAVGYGDAGNDWIDLLGGAAAHGGMGDDYITHHGGSDSNVSHGDAGNDTLTSNSYFGTDAADTLYGGAGNDELADNGFGRSYQYGGDGDDQLRSSDGDASSGTLEGGAGNDTITVSGNAQGFGGAGDDVLIDSGLINPLAGGAGNDVFVADWSDVDYRETTVTDFVPGQDKLAVLIGNRDLSELRLTIWQPEGENDTFVRIDTHNLEDPEVDPAAVFRLEGVSEFDVNDLSICRTYLNEPLDWAPDPAWTETLTGGAGDDSLTLNDSQVGFGEGGNDTLIANDAALADGGAGADSLKGFDASTLYGGAGDDSLTADFAAEAHGEAGNDLILSFGNPQFRTQPRSFGGEGDDTLQGDGVLYGGAGNDLIEPDADGALFNGLDDYSGAVYGGAGDDSILGEISRHSMTGNVAFHGDAGNDILTADGETSLYGDDGDDVVSGKGTLEGGAGNDRLVVGYDRDVSTDRAENLLYGQADGGGGNDTITASAGVMEDDLYTTSGSMAIRGGAGDDYIAASDIYAIDAGNGDDTVSILSDDAGGHQDVILGSGSDVVLADVAGASDYYGIGATLADFNPAEDRLAIIIAQRSTAPVITYTWDAARGGTMVRDDDGVAFFVEGVNHQKTPLSVSFYASEAALRTGTPYATL